MGKKIGSKVLDSFKSEDTRIDDKNVIEDRFGTFFQLLVKFYSLI